MTEVRDLAFPLSWYPLCRSRDLKRGKVIRQQAFGAPLAIFRTQQNRVGALHSVCAHMGADLARGRVIGECLQCPLHHWAYNVGGQCELIPHRGKIPARAHQTALHCEEHYGLVFAFLGGEPTFPFPRFDANTPRPLPQAGRAIEQHSRPSITDIDAAYQVLVANSFDGQHFATVHDRELLAPPSITSQTPNHLSIGYQARVVGQRVNDQLMRALGIKTVAIEIHCWGGNTMLVHNSRTANTILVAILPVDATHSRVFVTTVLGHGGKGLGARLLRGLQLALAHRLTVTFLEPDMAILQNLALRPRVLLPDADSCFIQWLRYWKALPRTPLLDTP